MNAPRVFTAAELRDGPDDFPYTSLEDMEAFRRAQAEGCTCGSVEDPS